MPKIINLVQSSPEWHLWRRWKIGASMSAAILGISPYQTKLQLWESIVLDEKVKANYAMERGTRLEDTARQWINNQRPHAPKFEAMCIEHDAIPWMIASLDGAVLNCPGCSVIKEAIEIKANGREAHSMALNGEVPAHYMSQLQHQMVVANLKTISYLSFDGEEGVIIEVNRDDDYITKKLMPALASFYQSLIDFKPPEPCDKDVIEITDPKACDAAKQYADITRNIIRLQAIQETLKEDLCGYAATGRCKIGDLKVTKIMRKGAIDYSLIPELKNVKLDPYRKEPVVSWRIS